MPHEDNIKVAHSWKDNCYQVLVKECEEVITSSTIKSMRVARLGPKKGKVLTKALQETVDKASH